MLAAAGLERLGRGDAAGAALDPADFVPAPGQGCLALEARADDARVPTPPPRLTDPEALAALLAERALVGELDASCHTPIGAHARARATGRSTLRAFVGLPDGSALAPRRAGRDPATTRSALGRAVAARLLAAGGARACCAAGRGASASACSGRRGHASTSSAPGPATRGC